MVQQKVVVPNDIMNTLKAAAASNEIEVKLALHVIQVPMISFARCLHSKSWKVVKSPGVKDFNVGSIEIFVMGNNFVPQFFQRWLLFIDRAVLNNPHEPFFRRWSSIWIEEVAMNIIISCYIRLENKDEIESMQQSHQLVLNFDFNF